MIGHGRFRLLDQHVGSDGDAVPLCIAGRGAVVSRRFAKRQQMQWTERGAHLLMQTRTRVLNGELEETFRRWYPKFRPEVEVVPVALKPAA
jgi:hypothetical protein